MLARQSALRDLLAGVEASQADRAAAAAARAERLEAAVAGAALGRGGAGRAGRLVEGVRELREGASALSEMLRRSLNYQRRLEAALHARLLGRLAAGAARFYGGAAAALAAAAASGPGRLRASLGPAAATLGAALGGELALDAVREKNVFCVGARSPNSDAH